MAEEYTPSVALADVNMDKGALNRVATGLSQLDHPLGGGLVSGSVVLMGGDPGVGKSTLALTACAAFAQEGRKVLYVTGEESLQQIRMRADRLGVKRDSLLLLATTDWDHIAAETSNSGAYVLVIDSAQTCRVPGLDSIPGSVEQVREVAHRARMLATETHVAVVLIGHSSRSTELAGPLVLEHFVDTVLDFEHDGRSSLRTLRTVKNRFGESGELGLFEMTARGLIEVLDPSKRLLVARNARANGTAVVATVEGTRPVLVEIQALVGRPSAEAPPRHFVGVDGVRTTMLAAILENSGLQVYNRGLYVNTGAGYRLREPGADVGITAAFASSLLKQPVREDTCVFGEVGLVGQIRPVRHPERRFEEARRQGFGRVICPQENLGDASDGIEAVGVATVRDVLAEIF
jgi:DNA repair protein RadA/Sms